MCVSCGCGQLSERYGEPRHITIETLQQAAAAAGLSLAQTVANVVAYANPASQLEAAERSPYFVGRVAATMPLARAGAGRHAPGDGAALPAGARQMAGGRGGSHRALPPGRAVSRGSGYPTRSRR